MRSRNIGIDGRLIKYLIGMELKGILVKDNDDVQNNIIIIIIITANTY